MKVNESNRKLLAVTHALAVCEQLSKSCPEVHDPEKAFEIALEHVRKHNPLLREFPSTEKLIALLVCDLLGYPVKY
jgi:hypothetical protein